MGRNQRKNLGNLLVSRRSKVGDIRGSNAVFVGGGEEEVPKASANEGATKVKVGSKVLVPALPLVNRPRRCFDSVKRNSSMSMDNEKCCDEGLPSICFDVDLVALKRADIAEEKKPLVTNDVFGLVSSNNKYELIQKLVEMEDTKRSQG